MSRGGYGKMTKEQGDQIPTGAHRVSWELHRGPIPAGVYVLHRCDVPACVNPEHLFLGSAADNVQDMIAKGRGTKGGASWFVGPPCPGRIHKKLRRKLRGRPDQKGAKNYNSKLTVGMVRDIRTKRVSRAEFARVYGVSFKAISDIWRGVSWVGVE